MFNIYFFVKTSIFDNFVYLDFFYNPLVLDTDWIEIDCVYCSAQIGIDTKFDWCLCDSCQYDPVAQDYLYQVEMSYIRLMA